MRCFLLCKPVSVTGAHRQIWCSWTRGKAQSALVSSVGRSADHAPQSQRPCCGFDCAKEEALPGASCCHDATKAVK